MALSVSEVSSEVTIKTLSAESINKLRSAKLIGGIGLIITIAAGFLSNIILGPIVSIIGFILFIIAMKYIADALGEPSIFNNTIVFAVGSIIVVIVIFALGLVGIVLASTKGYFPEESKLVTIIICLVLLWVGMVSITAFLKKALDRTAQELAVSTFRTAGSLYLWGTILSIIVIGLILFFIGEIILMIAFFSMPIPTRVEVVPISPPRLDIAVAVEMN